MPVPRSLKGRFSADRLYAPSSIAICGADTREGALVLANMAEAGFAGRVTTVGGPTGAAAIADLPEPPDLAVLACPPAEGAAALRALARLGTRAAVAITALPDLRALAQETGVRVLGPSAFGIAVPRLGLNASVAHMKVPPGRVALLTQSAAMARAVLDWAGPNGVGFSHISGVGGNADLGFGIGLDWLSRDPDTGVILMDIRKVTGRRQFISAARAASRLRPVVAIRPGGHLLDPSGQSQSVFEAALSRAGVFVVDRLDELLAAAETLTRSRPARGEGLAIVTNAIGPGRLAADAALAAGIKLAILPPEAQSALAASLPADLVYGLVYAGTSASASAQVAELAAMLGAVKSVGGVLVLLAPTGPGDAATVEAVIAAASIGPLPVLTCVMGETTGAILRRRLAEAGLPAFATPEQAVQGFAHLLRSRQAKIAARELPGRVVLDVAPGHAAVVAIIRGARAAARDALTADETRAILAAYGIQMGDGAPGERASLRVHDDPTFGPVIGFAAQGGRVRYGLPPLNLALAGDLARATGLADAACAAAAQLLVRVSALLVDESSIGLLGLDPVWLGTAGATCGDAAIWLRRAGDEAVLAIPPYPEHLVEHWETKGQGFVIRPIRPEDAEAHAALIRRVPPEDMRYRFFTAMREVSPEQMARLTQIDYEREMAFIAVRDTDQATVGVSRLVREMGTPRGEFAIVVEPAAKGLGLAQHLMTRLIEWGRAAGLAEIVGTVLADNHPMLGFVRKLGFTVRHVPEEPDVVEAVLAL